MTTSYRFPANFQWGVATAAYQIEGAARAGGRGASVWDSFSHRPGGTKTGESGDIACDHYHRFEADIALMAELGLKHYRLSIAWPRILPEGTGAVNEAGVDFYRRLLDCLHRHGIRPHVTLFHWDSPQALEVRYGSWRDRRIADDFAAYVDVVVRRLGDRVSDWMTINEIPCFTWLGYGLPGEHPPHAPGTTVATRREVYQTVHHALLAHGKAVQAIRAASPQPCRVSLVDNLSVPVPASEAPADVTAAGRAFRDSWLNGMISHGALTGAYSEEFMAAKAATQELPDIRAGDLAIIHQPLDAFGLNIYSGNLVRAPGPQADAKAVALGFETLPIGEHYPRLAMPWLNIVPDAIYWGVRHLREQCGFLGDCFISENGCAANDQLTPQGEVLDVERVLYLREYLRQAHRCCAEGLPLTGYFAWSFLDNFEWAWGYAKRFGLVYVNYETQQRIPKHSAKWYAECVRQNRVV